MQTYVESYVQHFDLDRHFRLNSTVTRISEIEQTGKWKVDIKGSPSEYFDKIVIATGPHVKATKFHLKGQDKFAGQAIHSQAFKRYVGAPTRRTGPF